MNESEEGMPGLVFDVVEVGTREVERLLVVVKKEVAIADGSGYTQDHWHRNLYAGCHIPFRLAKSGQSI